jgi:EmrB/QacA subfamily drug resistance transporter
MPFLVAAINVALPTMAREFNMEAVVMGWVSTVYFLAIAMVQVPCGRLADIFGRRKMFIIGLVLAAGSSFLAAFATSVPMLIISRVIQGIGAGMSFNNSIAILTTTIPAQERGRALGITMAGTYLGLSLGPFIGGVLTRQLGWQSIFHLSGVLGLVLLGLVFWALRREWIEAAGEKFDLIGSLAFAVSLAAFMYGFSVVNTVVGIILVVVGILGFIFFVRWENWTEVPVFNLKIFRRNRVFTLSSLAALITYVSTFAITFLLSLYLQYVKDYEADEAGLVLIVSSVLMAICTPLSGRISDRIEPALVASVGLAINCVALFLLIFVGSGTSLWYIILALAIYGVGIGLFSSPNSNAIMGSVENRILGVASGTLGTTRTAGMMLSMGIIMVLFSVYVGGSEITREVYPEFLDSMRVGFIIFTVVSALGFITQLSARKTKPAGHS